MFVYIVKLVFKRIFYIFCLESGINIDLYYFFFYNLFDFYVYDLLFIVLSNSFLRYINLVFK